MLEDLITSKTRVKILGILLADPSNMFHVRELVRRVHEEINAVRRELMILEKRGILKKEPRANRVYYFLDKNYPYYFDLIKLHSKSSGLGADIIKNRAKLGKIKFAMISGKYARHLPKNVEDVDLLIVGTVVLPELSLVVRREEEKNGREINYTAMTEEEFTFRKKRRDPFIFSIIYSSHIMVLGDEEIFLS